MNDEKNLDENVELGNEPKEDKVEDKPYKVFKTKEEYTETIKNKVKDKENAIDRVSILEKEMQDLKNASKLSSLNFSNVENKFVDLIKRDLDLSKPTEELNKDIENYLTKFPEFKKNKSMINNQPNPPSKEEIEKKSEKKKEDNIN
jgi:hypothetical protein